MSQLLPYHPKRSKRLTKRQIFDHVLLFSNDYADKSLLEYLPFYTDEVEISKRKFKKKRNTIQSRRHRRTKKRKYLTRRQILEDILPFFEDIRITRRERAFRGSAETYSVEVIDSVDLIDSLNLAKRSIIDFLKDQLQEKIGFKYNILVAITMKRWKSEIDAWEFVNMYLRSDAITVTNNRFRLDYAFIKILNLLDKWQGEGSGWMIDNVQDIHININNYAPIVGSSYIPTPPKLSNAKQGLINIKNTNDNECLRWCHVRMLNPTSNNPQRIKKADKEIAKSLDYSGIEFPVKQKDYPLIEQRFNINLNAFYYDKNIYPFYISEQHNERVLNVLLISDEEKSHYFFIKDFNRMVYSQTGTKNKGKKHFYCLQNFTTEEMLNRHKERCILIKGMQKPIYEEGTIEFTNYDKQIPTPFRIYADIESFNKKVNIRKGKSTTFYSKHIPYSVN